MLYGQYDQLDSHKDALIHPVWNMSFSWIKQNAPTLPEGEHDIQGRDIYANIQSAQTTSLESGFYEMHEEYIDIHYCLSGGEVIAYDPIGDLREKELNKEKDYQLFFPTTQQSLCTLEPNYFAIFFPKELHMPKLQDGKNLQVKKVVIKIKASILEA